jgi:uncharacterized phiE125 gp8 family phage protein
MLAPVLVTAPTDTPISLDEAKLHLRVTNTSEDTFIEGCIDAAVSHLDGWSGILGRALFTQTWRQDFGCFSDKLRLPLTPVASITHVKYYDGDNALQTLSSSVYQLFNDALGPYVGLAPDQDWVTTYDRPEAVAVTFVCGSDATAVPASIRAALLLMVGDLYAHRETLLVGSVSSVLQTSVTVDALLAPHRRLTV